MDHTAGLYPNETPELRERVRSLFSGLPEPYGDRLRAVLRLQTLFQEELAVCLQPSLNHWVALDQPHTLERGPEAMDALAAHITDSLYTIGLAVKLPGSNEPGRVAVIEDDRRHPPVVRFTLESLRKGPRARDPKFDAIPELELTNNPPPGRVLPLTLDRPGPGSRGRGG